MSRSFLARQERFAAVGSTNDVVRGWLAEGTPEVCMAVADEQTAGRGREGRSWVAPRGAGLLLSLGFRPGWLRPEATWRLAATASLAMAEAAEDVAGLADGTVRLKWPNDLVIDDEAAPNGAGSGGRWLKLGGVLGETDGLGTADPRAVVGMGINVDWPRHDFPAELADEMTSLREVARMRIAPATLLAAFLPRLEAGIGALRAGGFEAGEWRARQATTGRQIRLDFPDGRTVDVEAVGVDSETGALLIDDGSGDEPRLILSAEVRHVRPAEPTGSRGATAARV
jgi:BirA family transcriptional regulator, biotin operon repressor / biotin---[acetyl-CoA-carboxylase] ligase